MASESSRKKFKKVEFKVAESDDLTCAEDMQPTQASVGSKRKADSDLNEIDLKKHKPDSGLYEIDLQMGVLWSLKRGDPSSFKSRAYAMLPGAYERVLRGVPVDVFIEQVTGQHCAIAYWATIMEKHKGEVQGLYRLDEEAFDHLSIVNIGRYIESNNVDSINV